MMMSLEGGFQDQNTRFDEKCLLKKHIFSKLPYVKDHCITPCCLTGACKEMMDSGPEHLTQRPSCGADQLLLRRHHCEILNSLFWSATSVLCTGLVKLLRQFSAKTGMLSKQGVASLSFTSYRKCCQWQEIQHNFIFSLGCRNQRQSKLLLETLNIFSAWLFSQDDLKLPYYFLAVCTHAVVLVVFGFFELLVFVCLISTEWKLPCNDISFVHLQFMVN